MMGLTEDEVCRNIVGRLENIATSLAAVREELAELRGWRTRMDADHAHDGNEIGRVLRQQQKQIDDLNRWRDRATGLVIGAQTVGMAVTGILVKLLTHLGFF